MAYERKGDRYEWASRTPPPRADLHVRCGMDVQVRTRPGHWMIVGFDGQKARVVSVDVPGEPILTVPVSMLRPLWLPGVNCEAA